MPATVTLEENGHLVHIVLADPLTFEEFVAIEQEATAWADAAPHPLHTLMDVRNLRQIPQGFLKFRHAAGVAKMKEGQTAILGASPILQRAIEAVFVLTRNRNTRFFAADKAGAALAYLQGIIAREQEKPASNPT